MKAPLPDDPPSQRFRIWTRGNIGEVFPDPITPLNATAGFLRMLEPGWRLAMEETRTILPEDWEPDVPHIPIACFGGYLYLNLSVSRLAGVRFGLAPEAIDQQFSGGAEGVPSYASEARDSDANPAATAAAFEWLIGDVLGTTDLARFDAQRSAVQAVVQSRPPLESATDAELLQRIVGFDELFLGLWQSHILATNVSVIGLDGCAGFANAVGRPDLTLDVSAGLGGVDSAGASVELWPLSRMVKDSVHLTGLFDAASRRDLWAGLCADGQADTVAFVAAMKVFLERWGFRGPSEFELRSQTWGTNPDIVLAALGSMRHAGDDDAPLAGATRQAEKREQALAFMAGALADNPDAAGQFDGFRHISEMYLRARERSRMTVGLLLHEQRLAALELGRRAADRGHAAAAELIFMLTRDELCRYVEGDASVFAAAPEREASYLALFDRVPPFVVVGEAPPVSEWALRSAPQTANVLLVDEVATGLGASAGVVGGVVRIVTDPTDIGALAQGEILVAPVTDPAWTALFLAAAGVICEVGAPASHAAIVSRELGIPCVVSVADACARLADGMTVEIDGAAGTVRRVS